MDKCPCAIISSKAYSAILGRTFECTNDLLTSLRVCISKFNGHLVVLSQMSDPIFFGSGRMPKWLKNV